MPTIYDEIMKTQEDTDEYITIEEEERRQNGILFAVNDVDRMLEFG